MGRARIPLSALMAAVGIVAVDAAVFRGLLASGYKVPVPATGFLHVVVFACGVVPMASLLLLAASVAMPGMLRSGGVSSRFVGFELFGWATVLLFVAVSVASPNAIARYGSATAGVVLGAIPFSEMPEWADLAAEVALASAAFTLPQFLVALIGAGLIGRSGLTFGATRWSRCPEGPAARGAEGPPNVAPRRARAADEVPDFPRCALDGPVP